MMATPLYTLNLESPGFDEQHLLKHCWIMVLHASRIPPHVGLMINGSYSSLTIKGREIDVKGEVLLKTMARTRMETVAIRLIRHPVFSFDYQRAVFEHQVQRFTKVRAGEATCLSPVKLFLEEFYALPYIPDELLFELIGRLQQNAYIYQAAGFHVAHKLNGTAFSLPVYTPQQLQNIIQQETL